MGGVRFVGGYTLFLIRVASHPFGQATRRMPWRHATSNSSTPLTPQTSDRATTSWATAHW